MTDTRSNHPGGQRTGYYGQLSHTMTELHAFPARFLDVEPATLRAPARRAFNHLGGRAAALGWVPQGTVRLDTRGQIDSLFTLCLADAPGGADILLAIDWLELSKSAGVLSVSWHSVLEEEPERAWVTTFYGPLPLWRRPDPADDEEAWLHDYRVPLDDLGQ
jgi:hypothetical protein